MFSKALFKQSCKANATMWSIITFAVCFMLACVMLISGGGSIGEVKDQIQNTVIEGEINSQIEKSGISYYSLSRNASDKFDELFYTAEYQAVYSGALAQTGDATMAYKAVLAKFNEEYIVPTYGANDTATGKTAYGVIMTTLANENYSIATAKTDANRSTYLNNLCRNVVNGLISQNMTSEETISAMLEQLSTYGVDRKKYDSFGYDEETITELSNNAILSFISRFEFEKSELDAKLSAGEISEAEYKISLAKVNSDLTEELSLSLLSNLPEKVANALKEVGKMDLYSLIVGSIFYKMAGLLLPIIYMIMCSTSLIAGQVDSGSMAYVLSTSTKRKQVTFTQGVFLVSSLFLMFVCTTITSVVCLAIVKTESITITYGQIILLNLGAFITMFAMSGICFLASCWFDRSKKSMGIGGGLCMFFLVATMLGLFGSKVLPSIVRLDALNFFNYVSIISLFDVISIIGNTTTFIWKFAILVAIGIVCYVVGSIKFEKKDLPL